MDDTTLWTAGISAAVFGIVYLRALFVASSIEKRSKITDASMEEALRGKYVAITHVTEDDKKSVEGRYAAVHHHHHNHQRKLMDENGHYYRKLREFHRSSLALVSATIAVLFTLYYLALATNILNVKRASDGVLVNPWRWLVVLSLGIGAAHAFVGMACHFRLPMFSLFAFHGGIGRLIAGIAILTAPGSTIFWVLAATALFLSLVSFAFVYWKHDRVAGTSMVARVTVWYCVIALLVHSILFLGSYEVFAWFTYDATIILNAIADGILFLLPAIYIMTDAYYRSRVVWPLLPRVFYDDFGLGHYWKAEAKPQLLYLSHTTRELVLARSNFGKQGENAEADNPTSMEMSHTEFPPAFDTFNEDAPN